VKRDAVLNVFGKWTEKVLKWRRQEERSSDRESTTSNSRQLVISRRWGG